MLYKSIAHFEGQGLPIYNCLLDNTEGAIENEHSRETENIGHTRRRKTKQEHNTIQYNIKTYFSDSF